MKPILKISEVNQKIELPHTTLAKNQIEITNTSGHFVNNLKLYITDNTLPILEQSIIRERGALSYDPHTCFLELGNLAPEESACFEYKFIVSNHTNSLCNHMGLSYHVDNTPVEIKSNMCDLLS